MALRRWLFTGLACLLLLALLAGYKFLQVSRMIAFAESFPEASETVESVVVSRSRWTETARSVGEVIAPQAVTVRNDVGGRVIAVGFAAGDTVQQGQLLVQLDASEEIARLRAAEAEVELARLALARTETLFARKLASREAYDLARAEHAMTTASAESLRAIIAKKTVSAPFSGQAGLHTLQPGQYLAPESTLAELVGSLNTVWVDFSLPTSNIHLDTGSTVIIQLRDNTPEPLTGTVLAAEPALSLDSRLRRFRAVVDNGTGRLQPGMLVDVHVTTHTIENAVAVPDTAVLHDPQGSFVHLLVQDDAGAWRARQQRVVVAGERAGQRLVTEGLEEGVRIATQGSYKLRDGLLAHINPAPGAAP